MHTDHKTITLAYVCRALVIAWGAVMIATATLITLDSLLDNLRAYLQ